LIREEERKEVSEVKKREQRERERKCKKKVEKK